MIKWKSSPSRSIPRPASRACALSVCRTLDDDCAPVPPLFSADGMSVFMVSRSSGHIVRRQILSETATMTRVARVGQGSPAVMILSASGDGARRPGVHVSFCISHLSFCGFWGDE
jgi:hypothetical protein